MPSRIEVVFDRVPVPQPAAPEASVVLSSGDRWPGLKLEEHELPPMELRAHRPVGHRIVVGITPSIRYEYRSNGRWREKKYPARGYCSVVSAGQPNEVRWCSPVRLRLLEIEACFASQFMEIDPFELMERRGVDDQALFGISENLRREAEQGDYAGRLYGESMSMALTAHLAAQYAVRPPRLGVPRRKLTGPRLLGAIEYFNERVDQNVGLAEIAAAINMSPFHFARSFRATTGLAPHQYLLRLKIERSMQLLGRECMSVTAVAHRLGFADQSHFIRVFRRLTGDTPTHRFPSAGKRLS